MIDAYCQTFLGAFYLMHKLESLPSVMPDISAWIYNAKHRVSNIVPAITIVVINYYQPRNNIIFEYLRTPNIFSSRNFLSLFFAVTEIKTCIISLSSDLDATDTRE